MTTDYHAFMQALAIMVIANLIPVFIYKGLYSASELSLVKRPWKERVLGSTMRMTAIVLATLFLNRKVAAIVPHALLNPGLPDQELLTLIFLSMTVVCGGLLLRKASGFTSGAMGAFLLWAGFLDIFEGAYAFWKVCAFAVVLWECGAVLEMRPRLRQCRHAPLCQCKLSSA